MAARILVIEDNAANLELARYLLEHGGHEVLTASDGVEGLAVAQREQPNLVICDLQMPRMDGYEVLRRLRSDPAFARTPIVAVTAFSMPDDQRKVLVAGFDAYFSKPIEPENFVALIESFLPLLRLRHPAADQ
ncbi:response regulator [Methylibium sp.]|uniref:response regulator n=1 Tax=Methylibium sp. TaxID=2067992 RepID=UPI003D0D542B